jgi:hypothetical protein
LIVAASEIQFELSIGGDDRQLLQVLQESGLAKRKSAVSDVKATHRRSEPCTLTNYHQ